MARLFTHGAKAYLNNGQFIKEIGDKINNGIGTAAVWITDDERNTTFEVGDIVMGGEYIGKLGVPLGSGGVMICPVFHSTTNPNLFYLESLMDPLSPDVLFPDALDVNALVRKPFQALPGPSPLSDNFTGVAADEMVYLDTGNDIFRAAKGKDTVYGEAGNDRILGQGGNDTLRGDEGRDRLFGGAGADILSGGDGNDFLSGGQGLDRLSGGLGADILDGGAGHDDLDGNDGRDILRGGAGQDDLSGGTGSDKLYGGSGADDIYGGDGADFMFGGLGNDVFGGGAGRDRIRGNGGDDVIWDNAGNDAMWGGAGADIFIFSLKTDPHGRDRILDFNAAVDKVYFYTDDPDQFHVTHESGNTVIDYDTGLLTLIGVTIDLTNDAFLIT